MDEKIQICPHCGREVTPGTENCHYCGRPVVIRARGTAPASTVTTTPTARSAGTPIGRTIATPHARPTSRRTTTAAGDKEPASKRKRMLRLSILLFLVAIILYGTYELLG